MYVTLKLSSSMPATLFLDVTLLLIVASTRLDFLDLHYSSQPPFSLHICYLPISDSLDWEHFSNLHLVQPSYLRPYSRHKHTLP